MDIRPFLGIAFMAAPAAIVVGLADPAEAATLAPSIKFNFASGVTRTSYGSSFNYSKDGLNVTASSGQGLVTKTSWGLGVRSRLIDSNQLDGFGPDETLNLAFNKAVQLVSAKFTFVDRNDDVAVRVDGTEIFNGSLFRNQKVTFTDNGGQLFSFGATDWNDNYYLKKVEVFKYADGTDVPEPLTIFGTIAALGASVALKRKHTHSSEEG